jgi:hypothetical protein
MRFSKKKVKIDLVTIKSKLLQNTSINQKNYGAIASKVAMIDYLIKIWDLEKIEL